ncbi:MAG: hypothetical protein GXY58_03170 [Planctomycetaceae bacterium]|nr:hypothetical protein [Planctomycetaceae bacterium]
MEISSLATTHFDSVVRTPLLPATPEGTAPGDREVREAFHDFVGQTFYGQLLSAMRKTVGKPAYFHGGRAEEVFQNQLDQVLSEKLSDATAETFTEPMYQLFTLSRR